MKKLFMIMSIMLLTMGAMAQSDKQPNFEKRHHMRPRIVNIHAMKEVGVDSATIAKVMKLHKDTSLCKNRDEMNKKVRNILGTETYIKYLEKALAQKNMRKGFRGGHRGPGMHHKHMNSQGCQPGCNPECKPDCKPEGKSEAKK